MTTETKHRFRRDFMPRGAVRRGVIWLVVCAVIAYAPTVAHAIQQSNV